MMFRKTVLLNDADLIVTVDLSLDFCFLTYHSTAGKSQEDDRLQRDLG
jgi:hypothetical protein